MANFKNLEMASALSQYQYITIKNTFFGLSKKAVYQPTNSTIESEYYEYSPDQGSQLEHLLNLPKEKLLQEVQSKTFPKPTPVGQYRLECCFSADQTFAALQLFRFSDFSYKPVTELLIFTENEVTIIRNIIK